MLTIAVVLLIPLLYHLMALPSAAKLVHGGNHIDK